MVPPPFRSAELRRTGRGAGLCVRAPTCAAFRDGQAGGPHLAPGEPAAERDSFSEVVLVGRLREAIRRMNSAIPSRTLATLRDTLLPKLLSGELSLAAACANVGAAV
jgi:hypothetical protein